MSEITFGDYLAFKFWLAVVVVAVLAIVAFVVAIARLRETLRNRRGWENDPDE